MVPVFEDHCPKWRNKRNAHGREALAWHLGSGAQGRASSPGVIFCSSTREPMNIRGLWLCSLLRSARQAGRGPGDPLEHLLSLENWESQGGEISWTASSWHVLKTLPYTHMVHELAYLILTTCRWEKFLLISILVSWDKEAEVLARSNNSLRGTNRAGAWTQHVWAGSLSFCHYTSHAPSAAAWALLQRPWNSVGLNGLCDAHGAALLRLFSLVLGKYSLLRLVCDAWSLHRQGEFYLERKARLV